MKALVFDGSLRFDPSYPPPDAPAGWAVIRVRCAGICGTDVEITRGYMNFHGVPGHEFTGSVTECDDSSWLDQRVVGEINAACGECEWCRKGLGRHCPNRTVLGILRHDGCMAEYCTLPVRNLHRVPDEMPDDHAVFIELLAAAYEILEQVPVSQETRCIVLGDGKLGILCAWVLSTVCGVVTLLGHHESKLRLAAWNGIGITTDTSSLEPADLVVEATGRAEGLEQAAALCLPRGTIALKSTIAEKSRVSLAPLVINEITVVGSRCGLFDPALRGYAAHRYPLDRLIAARYPLEQGLPAFEAARAGGLKVLLDVA